MKARSHNSRAAQSESRLFLAIHSDVYDNTFGLPDGEALQLDEKINLIIFDVDKEEIVKWIS